MQDKISESIFLSQRKAQTKANALKEKYEKTKGSKMK